MYLIKMIADTEFAWFADMQALIEIRKFLIDTFKNEEFAKKTLQADIKTQIVLPHFRRSFHDESDTQASQTSAFPLAPLFTCHFSYMMLTATLPCSSRMATVAVNCRKYRGFAGVGVRSQRTIVSIVQQTGAQGYGG